MYVILFVKYIFLLRKAPHFPFWAFLLQMGRKGRLPFCGGEQAQNGLTFSIINRVFNNVMNLSNTNCFINYLYYVLYFK